MKRPQSITAKLKQSDPEIQNYVTELESINLKLQKHIGKLQAQNVSYQNEIAVLKKAQPKVTVQIQNFTPDNNPTVTEVFAQAKEQLAKAKQHKNTGHEDSSANDNKNSHNHVNTPA